MFFLWNIRRSHYSIAENDVVQREWQGWSQYPWKLIAAIGWCWWSWYGYRLCNLLTKSWHQLVSCFGGKCKNEKMNLCDLFPPGEKPNSSRDHAECCQCWFAMLCLLWIYPWVWGKWRESEMWGSEKWSDFCCLVGGMTVWLVWDPRPTWPTWPKWPRKHLESLARKSNFVRSNPLNDRKCVKKQCKHLYLLSRLSTKLATWTSVEHRLSW